MRAWVYLALVLMVTSLAVAMRLWYTRGGSLTARVESFSDDLDAKMTKMEIKRMSDAEFERHLRQQNVYGLAYQAYGAVNVGVAPAPKEIEDAVQAYRRGAMSADGFEEYFKRAADAMPRLSDGPDAEYDREEAADVDDDMISKHVRAVYQLVSKRGNVKALKKNVRSVKQGLISLHDLYKGIMQDEEFVVEPVDEEEGFEDGVGNPGAAGAATPGMPLESGPTATADGLPRKPTPLPVAAVTPAPFDPPTTPSTAPEAAPATATTTAPAPTATPEAATPEAATTAPAPTAPAPAPTTATPYATAPATPPANPSVTYERPLTSRNRKNDAPAASTPAGGLEKGIMPNDVFDMKGENPEAERPMSVPRFNIREIGKSEAVAIYTKVTGSKPEDAIEEYIVNKYVQWEGDMSRLENLINTMWSIAQAEAEGTDYSANDYLYIITKSIDKGYTAAETKLGVKDWIEYETERAMQRPDVNIIGPGDGMLKRPWAGAAKQLVNSKTYGRSELQSVDRLEPERNPDPNAEPAVNERADWMFE